MTKSSIRSSNMIKKKKKITSREWQLYSLGAIPMLLVVIFKYLPMFGIIVAFKNFRYDKGIIGSDWVGFKNFEFFFKSSDFVRVVRNTIGMNFIFIIAGLVAAVALAILMYELTSRLRTKIYMTIFITPHFLSWVVVSYIAYAFLDPNNGVINSFLASIGMDKISWYTEPGYWPVILTICNVWKHMGMNSIIYYASLMSIDSCLIEAARIDGANKWDVTKHVVIPSLVPLMVILTIIELGKILSADFGLFYQIPRNVGMLYETTDVIPTYTFRTMRVIGDMGTGSAVGLVSSVVGLALVLISNKLSKMIDPEGGLL